MAIVIKSNPVELSSVHGDLLFVVHEATKVNDPVNYPDYRYIADIYVTGQLITRIKKVPQPDNKFGVFNIGQVVRDFISATFNPISGSLRAQTIGAGEFTVKATVKFGEEFNFTTYTNLTVDAERSYYNHYNGRLLGKATLLSDHVDLATGATRSLTHRPLQSSVYSNAAFNFLPYWAYNTNNYTVTIKSYTPGGANVATINQTLTPIAADTVDMLNVSPALITTLSATFLNGAGYYIVKIGANEYRFDLVCEPRYEVYTLHFLNQLGAFDSRDFTKVSRKTISVTKANFGRLPYQIDGNGNVGYYNGNNVYNETKATYSSQFTEKLVLNTDVLTDDEYNWLAELVLSPLVYVEIDGYFVPCSIAENNYEYRKNINDKLTNLTVNVEFGDQFNAQYR